MKTTKNKVLLCSSDPTFVSGFLPQLQSAYEVQTAGHPDQALFMVKEWEPMVALVDGRSFTPDPGPQFRQWRSLNSMSIFVLCRDGNLSQEEEAFQSGADHWLCLPCDYRSLDCRLQAQLRKGSLQAPRTSGLYAASSAPSSTIAFGTIEIYPQDFLIKNQGEVVSTTPTQFRLLLAFVNHREQLLSRSWIKETVWNNAKISPRSIDAQISKLKKLLPDLDPLLVNVYGKGYILTEPKNKAA